MVFEYPIFAENFAYGLGILIDDGSIGNDVDDAIEIVLLRMMKGIAQTSQCFATTCWYCECINALRISRSF